MPWRALATRIVLLMVVATLAVVVSPAEPAAAEFGCDSRQAPNPKGPTSGLSGLVAQAPDTMPAGEPFDAEGHPTPALWGQYGTAGLWWPVYDPGCNPAAEWGMRMATGFAQWGNEVTNFVLNTTAAVRSWAWRADWLGPIDDTMNSFTGGLRDTYTGPMMGVALVAAGLMIVWRGRRAQLSHTATLAGWAVAMMVLGVLAMSAPTRAAEFVDTYGIGAAGTVESAVAGVEVGNTPPPCPTAGLVYDPAYCQAWTDRPRQVEHTTDPFVGLAVSEVAWQNWLVGMFGSSTSATARDYGPRFYEAMALTWEEAALPDDERQAVIEQKKDDFKALAEELRDVDNAAFKVLQGKTAFEDRMATAWVGALLMAILTFFAAVAAICVLLGRLVARFGVMAFPVVVPFGMVAEYRQPVMSLWKTVSGAVVTAITYTLASGLMIRLLSAMLQSTMPLLLVVAIALGLTVALLVRLRAAQVIRTVAGLKIARDLTRDRIRTDDDDSADADDESRPDATSGPTVRRENTPAPAPPAPAPIGHLPAGTALRGEVLAAGRRTTSSHEGTRHYVDRTDASGWRHVIDADVVETSRSHGPSAAAGELGPGDQDRSRPGSSAGVTGSVDPRPAVRYMGPPGTNAGETYYLPPSADEAQQHHQHQRLSPRAPYDDHVSGRDETGRPIIDVYEPDPERGRPARPMPPAPRPSREAR
jgi:hypothetical protein